MASRRIVLSYVLDWLIIIAAIAIALALSTVNPDFHPFCLLDISTSYPYQRAKVSPALFIFLAVIMPVIVTASVSLYFNSELETLRLPIRTRDALWRHKLWQLNASLLGLGISLATTTIIVTGTKNLTGKPRPNFLERCQPDLDNIAAHTVGGFGQEISPLWVMVNQEICQQPDKEWLNDGFRSFPSGYAAVSFAGLWYLTLYLSAKFGVVIPYPSRTSGPIHQDEAGELSLENSEQEVNQPTELEEVAAPPVFLLPLPYVPLGLAIFIAGTRYFDFTNHGFDVIAGAAIGTATAWFGFRWYHPPLLDHTRAAWPSRNSDRAFYAPQQ